MPHVAVVGLSMVHLVSVVVVAMVCVGLVALRTGPVPLTQGWRHSLLAWDIVRLHEGHARQHRLAAQQPSLVMQRKYQSKSRAVKNRDKSHKSPFDLVTSSVSTMWALFKSNKSTMSKCFYKNKPFQIILISASTKGTKVIIFAMTAHASSGGMEEGVWKGNRETGTRMFLEMKSDSHWPISYGLEQSCWNGVSSSLFECVCVWGKQGGHFTQD